MSAWSFWKPFVAINIPMEKLPHDFKEFLKLLNTHGVEYLLVGGYAVNFYGYPRVDRRPCRGASGKVLSFKC